MSHQEYGPITIEGLSELESLRVLKNIRIVYKNNVPDRVIVSHRDGWKYCFANPRDFDPPFKINGLYPKGAMTFNDCVIVDEEKAMQYTIDGGICIEALHSHEEGNLVVIRLLENPFNHQSHLYDVFAEAVKSKKEFLADPKDLSPR